MTFQQTAVYSPPEIQQGVAYGWDILVTGYDLTGRTIKCQLRRSVSDVSVALDWTTVTTPVAVNTSGTPHRIQWRLTDEESAYIDVGRYVYDVEVWYNGHCEKRLLSGTWCVSGEVTRG